MALEAGLDRFVRNETARKPRTGPSRGRDEQPHGYSHHHRSSWCPGPDSNRHGVSPKGF